MTTVQHHTNRYSREREITLFATTQIQIQRNTTENT